MTKELDKSKRPAFRDENKKRAYIKPSTRHETVFEVMALACGKISGTSGPCAANRKTS